MAALAFLPASRRRGRLDAETERERSDLSSKGVKICSVSAKVFVGGKRIERGMNDEDEIEPWLVALLCRDAATAEAGTWWAY